MKNAIISLTHSRDYYTVDKVNHALKERGYQVLRLNCDQFPGHYQLSFSSGNPLVIQHPEGDIKGSDIAGVWMRKNHSPVLPDTLSPDVKRQCVRESEQAKNILLNSIDAPWIDRFDDIRRAENKLLQLQLAAQVGLATPATLISNSPDQVRRFYHQLKGQVVVKMLTPASQSMQGPPQFVYTSELLAEQLDHMEGLSLSPMVFQQKIQKEYELRIAYIDGHCFCGMLTTHNATPLTQVDWRQAKPGELVWKEASIPQALRLKLKALMDKLSLTFGAFDIIKSPTGYVFLEVNPSGEWGMLEKDLDLPIATHIAAALHNKIVAANIRNSA